MTTYYCPKCFNPVKIRSTLYAMATRYLPEEYKETAECPACGWEGDAMDACKHEDLPSKTMRCDECKNDTLHTATKNGWVCWTCGVETDE